MTKSECYLLGLKNKQKYITDTSVPSELFNEPSENIFAYLDGLFLYSPRMNSVKEYAFCYSTNIEFMESLARLMKKVGLETRIYPYVNCECEYGIEVLTRRSLSGEDHMNDNENQKSVVDTDTIQISTTEITEEHKRAIKKYVDFHINKLESLRKKENERSEF